MNALGFPTRLAKLLVEACEKEGVQVRPHTDTKRLSRSTSPFSAGRLMCVYERE